MNPVLLEHVRILLVVLAFVACLAVVIVIGDKTTGEFDS